MQVSNKSMNAVFTLVAAQLLEFIALPVSLLTWSKRLLWKLWLASCQREKNSWRINVDIDYLTPISLRIALHHQFYWESYVWIQDYVKVATSLQRLLLSSLLPNSPSHHKKSCSVLRIFLHQLRLTGRRGLPSSASALASLSLTSTNGWSTVWWPTAKTHRSQRTSTQ